MKVRQVLDRYEKRVDRKFPAWVSPDGEMHLVNYENYGWDGHLAFASEMVYGDDPEFFREYPNGKTGINMKPGPHFEFLQWKDIKTEHDKVTFKEQQDKFIIWEREHWDEIKQARDKYRRWEEAWSVLVRRGWLRLGYSHYTPMLRRDIYAWVGPNGMGMKHQDYMSGLGLNVTKARVIPNYCWEQGMSGHQPDDTVYVLYGWSLDKLGSNVWDNLPAEKWLADELVKCDDSDNYGVLIR